MKIVSFNANSVRTRLRDTADTEAQFLTNKPWLYTTIVFLIFVFTSAIYVLFACLLEKQQRQGLTLEESEQVQVLSNHFNHIMMVRAKSAALLAERGHDVSKLALAS